MPVYQSENKETKDHDKTDFLHCTLFFVFNIDQFLIFWGECAKKACIALQP